MQTLLNHLNEIDTREPHPYRVEVFRKQEPFFSEKLADWIRFYDINNPSPQMFDDAKVAAESAFGNPVYLCINALTDDEEAQVLEGNNPFVKR